MKILIADDDRVTRRMLEVLLTEWGYQTLIACDGLAAWQILQGDDGPKLAILDWLMPGMEGLEVCRKVRQMPTRQPTYIILLTVKGNRQDIITGLQNGADDYVTKPFDPEELQARVHTGFRIVELQRGLNGHVRQLEDALSRVKQLQGLLPICSYCKSIRDDKDYWQRVDDYIAAHSDVRFTHGICPNCYRDQVEPELERMRAAAKAAGRDTTSG
jgi:sigma-B regulation protein RsbU (phosphoserine phosphatase)